VRELENQISHGQCANLAEEKRVMVEIKQLNATKGLITQYQAQRQNQTDDSENKLSLEERRAEATKRLDEAKKEAEKLEKELDLMRAKQDQGAPNVNDLWKEQKELYGKLKDHRATIRTVNVEFKEEVNKFRTFQRELFNYQRGKKKIEAEQRRVEWEKRRSEEDGPVDADVPSDDPLVGHPWIDEILQCQDLEKVLGLLMPKSEAAPVAAPVDTKVLPVAEKGMFIGGKDKGDDDDLFGGLVKKSKSAKKAAAPMKVAAPKAVQLRMDTIVNLGNIGVEIPKTNADLARVVELIKEKKKAFEGMTEEDKKKAKAAKSGAKAKESKPVPASAVSLSLSLSLPLSLSPSVSLSLSLSPSRSSLRMPSPLLPLRSLSLSLTHSVSPPFPSLSHTHTHNLLLSLTRYRKRCQAYCCRCGLSLSFCPSLSLPLFLSLSYSITHSLSSLSCSLSCA